MTEGAAHGGNGRGEMRLEAERMRPSYSLPTWFPEDSGSEEGERRSERLTNWHPPSLRISERQRLSRDYDEETAEAFEPARRPRPARRRGGAPLHHIARAAAAGALSVIIGALSALIVYDITSGGAVRAALAAIFTGAPLPAGSNSSETTTIAKKVVVTAKLDALDVVGSAAMPIPLSLKAESGEPDQAIALKLSGIPRDAYLTAGTKLDSNDWLLKPGQELGVKLIVPEAPPLPLSLAVAAIEPNSGELVAPVREFKVQVKPNPAIKIEPANAPPGRTDFAAKPVPQPAINIVPAAVTAQPAATPIPKPASEATALIERGDALMESGELVAARSFYDRALGQGEIQAAFKLAQTYDPEIFAQHQVRGLRPDAAQALKYYTEAAAGGITEAQAAIGRLGTQ